MSPFLRNIFSRKPKGAPPVGSPSPTPKAAPRLPSLPTATATPKAGAASAANTASDQQKRKAIQRPGSRGGKFYIDDNGVVVYGTHPTGKRTMSSDDPKISGFLKLYHKAKDSGDEAGAKRWLDRIKASGTATEATKAGKELAAIQDPRTLAYKRPDEITRTDSLSLLAMGMRSGVIQFGEAGDLEIVGSAAIRKLKASVGKPDKALYDILASLSGGKRVGLDKLSVKDTLAGISRDTLKKYAGDLATLQDDYRSGESEEMKQLVDQAAGKSRGKSKVKPFSMRAVKQATEERKQHREKLMKAQQNEELPDIKGMEGVSFYPVQKKGINWLTTAGRGVLAFDTGTGKAQPLDAKVLTPSGWKLMGDIKVGDNVVGDTGKPAQVVGVYPQGKLGIYKVMFSDGTSTECCDQHLWLINSSTRNYLNYPWRVKPLYDIRNTLYEKCKLDKLRHYIPLTQPVQFESIGELPVHPYLMGALLGDGCLSQDTISFSTADKEMINRLKNKLPEQVKFNKSKSGEYDYRIVKVKNNGGSNELMQALIKLNLSGRKSHDKFIPNIYKFASIKDRKYLLRGLMDTDGSITQKSHNIEYSTASKQLADDIIFLIQSLGGTAKLKIRTTSYTYKGENLEGKLSHRLSISMPKNINPFALHRKSQMFAQRQKYFASRRIVGVEYVGVKSAQCILLNNRSHLYLTDNFIVTHNTPTALGAVQKLMSEGKVKGGIVFATKSGLSQWGDDVDGEIRKFVPDAKIVMVDGTKAQKLKALKNAGDADYIVVGWSAMSVDEDDEVLNALGNMNDRAVVLDEGIRVKNMGSQRTRNFINQFTDKEEYLFNLTASPGGNNPMETYNLVNSLYPGVLGTVEAFKNRYYKTVKSDDGRREIEYVNLDQLHKDIEPYIFIKKMSDPDVGINLPPVVRTRGILDMDANQTKAYAKSVEGAKSALLKVKDQDNVTAQEKMNILAAITKSRQAAIDPWLVDDTYTGESVKINGLIDSVGDALLQEPDRGSLCFSDMGSRAFPKIQEKMAKKLGLDPNEIGIISGQTSSKDRDRVRKGLNDGTIKVALLSIRAASEGLNLQKRSNRVFLLDMPWNPELIKQAIARVFRRGQERQVVSTSFIAKNTIDEHMVKLLDKKSKMFSAIKGQLTDAALAKNLTFDDFAELLGFTREQIKNGETERNGDKNNG